MSHHVLVVDDERSIVELVAALLKDEGYRVSCAYDGAEADAAIEQLRPDLVITDIMMPRLDGLTWLKRMRERGETTPVLLMSAAVGRLPSDGVSFIRKPFDIEDLLSHVERLISVRKS